MGRRGAQSLLTFISHVILASNWAWSWTAGENGVFFNATGAACFTPYHITPGGGEKYLLSAARAMQSMGYHVDVLVLPENVCQTKQCVLDVSTHLRVGLDPDLLTVKVIKHDSVVLLAGPYQLFFALGNEKYPVYRSLGFVNMYMCQFPMDLDRVVPEEAFQHTIPTYDVVVLNSYFSNHWYIWYGKPMFTESNNRGKLFPRVQVLHPPVTLYDAGAATQTAQRKNIVMLGRFYAGRRSKGHAEAIRIFSRLNTSLPPDTKLIMTGYPMPGHSRYIDDLHTMIHDLGLKSRVEIHLGTSPEGIVEMLRTGLVQWHITGLGMPENPSSREHFGIAIVEGMSAGCIPIAFIGGATDIIEHGSNGFIVATSKQVLLQTENVFAMGADTQLAMRERCISGSQAFTYAKFEEKFRHMVNETTRHKKVLTGGTAVPNYKPRP